MSQPSLLVTHPWIGNGGSEATAMWVLRALQEDFDLSLVTAGGVDFEKLNHIYEAQVNPEKITIISAPRLPLIKRGDQLVALQHALFQRYCRSLADQFDLCISSCNFVDFGKPGVQLVADLSFDEHLREKFYVHGQQKFHHRPNLLRKAYLTLKECIAPERITYHQRGDLVLANSNWTARQLEGHCGLEKIEVLYPPVKNSTSHIKGHQNRSRFGFCYIGRIAPEKKIEKIIAILERVRSKGYPVQLDLAGNTNQSLYEKSISEMAAGRPWINDRGYLSGENKREVLLKNSIGIQACRCEAFGIATAELASAGCLPLVPKNCGPSEIVPFPELQFHGIDDAVKRIVDLLEPPSLAQELRHRVAIQMPEFSASRFVQDLRKHVEIMFQKTKNGYRSPSCHSSGRFVIAPWIRYFTENNSAS